ncbi:unnamed protein product, partial [Brenthis ino]
MYRLAFIVFVASVSANSCPEVQPVDNFNITSYGQGIWYEVARYSNSGENIGECGSAEYKLDGNEIKVKNFHAINKKATYVEGVAKLAADAGKSGKVDLNLPHGAGGVLNNIVLNILAIDYNRYLIAYSCKIDEASHHQIESAWILSRSKILSDESKTAVDKFLKESKILSADKFVWPKFSEDACKVDA